MNTTSVVPCALLRWRWCAAARTAFACVLGRVRTPASCIPSTRRTDRTSRVGGERSYLPVCPGLLVVPECWATGGPHEHGALGWTRRDDLHVCATHTKTHFTEQQDRQGVCTALSVVVRRIRSARHQQVRLLRHVLPVKCRRHTLAHQTHKYS